MNQASQNIQLPIVQGATFILPVTFYNADGDLVNLTGYTAKMMFRTTVQDTGDPIISLSTDDNSIIINPSQGLITAVIPATVTATLTDGQLMYWDLFIYSPTNIVTPLLAGQTIVKGSTIR